MNNEEFIQKYAECFSSKEIPGLMKKLELLSEREIKNLGRIRYINPLRFRLFTIVGGWFGLDAFLLEYYEEGILKAMLAVGSAVAIIINICLKNNTAGSAAFAMLVTLSLLQIIDIVKATQSAKAYNYNLFNKQYQKRYRL